MDDILSKIGAWLQGKKAYLVMVVAILSAILGYAEGQLTLVQMVSAILAAMGFGATRSAISKIGK
jgi:hypothetical protein